MDRPAIELQILDELAAIRRAIEALYRSIEAQRAEIQDLRVGRQGEDGARLEALLVAINREFGNDAWTVAGLFETVADGFAEPELQRAIVGILGGQKSGHAHRRLGVFLSRHLGAIGRCRLELIPGRTREGKKYKVTLLTPLTPGAMVTV